MFRRARTADENSDLGCSGCELVVTQNGLTGDAVLALRQGWEQQQLGRLDEAERAYRKVLDVAPGNPDALHFMGLIEAQRGRPEAAASLLAQSLAHNPRNPHGLFNYAT